MNLLKSLQKSNKMSDKLILTPSEPAQTKQTKQYQVWTTQTS